MDARAFRRGHWVYPIIDDADLYGVGCSGPAVQAGSGLTAPGLAKNKSPLAVSLLGPLPGSKKRSQFFSRAVSARPLKHQTHREHVYRPFQFQKRRQLFIGVHNKASGGLMLCGDNPKLSPVAIRT